MWERPVDALLPGFYLKKEFLKNLNTNFGKPEFVQPIFDPKSKPSQLANLPGGGGGGGGGGQAAGPQHPTEEGFEHYLVSRGVLSLPADEDLLEVFQSALKGAPLPAPWSMWFDKTTRTLFFTNTTTCETQWSHPLHRLLEDLAKVGRRVLSIPFGMRAEHLAALNRTWDSDARAEILKWQTANEDGREYYYNVETNDVMWERPVDAVLPAFYLKKQFLKKLSLSHQEKVSDQRRAEPALLPQLPIRRDSGSTKPSTATTVTSTMSSPQSDDVSGTRQRTSKTRRASRKLSDVAQLDDNWEYYLTTQGIVNVPGEENLLRVFQSVLKRAPMPAPWKVWHDKLNNRFFFVKKSTGATSWQHPLNSVLQELAGIARHHFTLPESRQADHISMWGSTWDAQADVEIAKWNAATDEDDMEYFFNSETNETMWERPEDVVLPELFLRRQFLTKLAALQCHSKEEAEAQKVESECEIAEAVPASVKRPTIRATVKAISPKPQRKGIQQKGIVLRSTRPAAREVQDDSEAVIGVLTEAVQGDVDAPVYTFDFEAQAVSVGIEAAQHVEGSFEKAKSAAKAAGLSARAAALNIFEQSVAAGRAALAVVPTLPASERAKAAAISAAEVHVGNLAEQLQAAALAAYATSQDFDDRKHATEQATTFVARELGPGTADPESLQQLTGDATLFASAVNLGIHSCKALQLDEEQASAAGSAAAFYVFREGGRNELASAVAACAASQTARNAGWAPDAQVQATVSAAKQAGSSPGQLEEIARRAAHDAGIKDSLKSVLARAGTLVEKGGRAEPLSSDNDLEQTVTEDAKSFSFAAPDSSLTMLYEQIDSSPQSSTLETASSFGQTGRLSLTGSQRFRGLCTIDEVQSALTDAERCLAAFEEERKLQMKTLHRKRSRNKLAKDRLPRDIEVAMTEAQKILSTFDDERRLQLQMFKNSRNRSGRF